MIATPIPRETLLHVAKALPAAPRILAELGHLLLDPNSDMAEVTALLRPDAALTARIIRISNSAFYTSGQAHGSLEEALARVGYMEVYRLTGIAAVSQVADRDLALYGITGPQLRENSLLVALVIELLARRLQMDFRLAYTAGLLRSIGKIALDGVARTGPYRGAYAAANGPLAEWETGFVGMSNCDAAAVIMAEWRFPAATIAGIHRHYLSSPDRSALAQLLNLACGVAERSGHGLPGEAGYWAAAPVTISDLAVDADMLADVEANAMAAFTQLRSAVG